MSAGVLTFGGGLLRSGAVVVLPRREALTDVTIVDGDSHQVVVRAGVDLDPESDRVWNRTVKQCQRHTSTNSPSTSGASFDGDLDTLRSIFQTHPGHARALVRVRADAQEQSGLVGTGRLGDERELGDEHLIVPLLAGLVMATRRNTSGRRTHSSHMRSTCATTALRTGRRGRREGLNTTCWSYCRWSGLGRTPGSPQGERSSRAKPAGAALSVDGPEVESALKVRDGRPLRLRMRAERS